MNSDVNWLLFLLLLMAGIVGRIAIVPLSMEMQKVYLNDNLAKTSSFWRMLLRQNILMLPLLCLSVFSGLVLSSKLGFRIEILELANSGTQNTLISSWYGIALGLSCGVFALLVMIVTRRLYRQYSFSFFRMSLGSRLVAGVFHGGITEELVFRLFLFSLFVWFFSASIFSDEKILSQHTFWLANILAAALFAVAHLPATIALSHASKPAVSATFIINWLVGLGYGYAFWHWSFEAAVLAHMFTHLVLQVLAPVFVLEKSSD